MRNIFILLVWVVSLFLLPSYRLSFLISSSVSPLWFPKVVFPPTAKPLRMIDFDLSLAVASLIGTYAFLRALLYFTQDTREPLSVEDVIPFLGPVIAMGRKGAKFHNHMR